MKKKKQNLAESLTETQNSHFRRWKSGKQWIFASTVLLAVVGGSLGITQGVDSHSAFSTSVVSAAVLNKVQVNTIQWNENSELLLLSGQKPVATVPGVLPDNGQGFVNVPTYKLKLGDSYLITNVGDGVDLKGTIVSYDSTFYGSSVLQDGTAGVTFYHMGQQESSSGKYTTHDSIGVDITGTASLRVVYTFVDHGDPTHTVEVPQVLNVFFTDLDNGQGLRTDLIDIPNKGYIGAPNTNVGRTGDKTTLYSNSYRGVQLIGDQVDNDGWGFVQGTSLFKGSSFYVEYTNNITNWYPQAIGQPTVDGGILQADPSQNTKQPNKFYYLYTLFGSGTTPQLFTPTPPKIAPVAPKAVTYPTPPTLDTPPVVPELPKVAETPVPTLPAAPTFKTPVSESSDPTKSVKDNQGNDLNGKATGTDVDWNYSINQAINGSATAYSDYQKYVKAVADWKAQVAQIISDYQDDHSALDAATADYLKKYQAYSDAFDKLLAEDKAKIAAYETAYAAAKAEDDANWKAYNEDYVDYLKDYARYDEDYALYKSSGGADEKVAKVAKATQPVAPVKKVPLLPVKALSQVDKIKEPAKATIKTPAAPDTTLSHYLYSGLSITDTFDTSKVDVKTAEIKVLDKSGQALDKTDYSVKVDTTGKEAKVTVTFSEAYVKSDAFYANGADKGYELIIPTITNIDDQTKKASEQVNSNRATVTTPNDPSDPKQPDTPDPKTTNTVTTTPKYKEASVTKEESLDNGKTWTKETGTLKDFSSVWSERIHYLLSNHADYANLQLIDNWESVKWVALSNIKFTLPDGTVLKGTIKVLNSKGEDVTKDYEAHKFQQDGVKEVLRFVFTPTDLSQFTRSQNAQIIETIEGQTLAGATANELKHYLQEDKTIEVSDTATLTWTDKTPDDGDKGSQSKNSNTVKEKTPPTHQPGEGIGTQIDPVKKYSVDGKKWTDELKLSEHDQSYQAKLTFPLSNYTQYKTLTLSDYLESTQYADLDKAEVLDAAGKAVEGTWKVLNAKGEDVTIPYKEKKFFTDGVKETLILQFIVKDVSVFNLKEDQSLTLSLNDIGLKGTTGKEESQYLNKEGNILIPNTGNESWTGLNPNDELDNSSKGSVDTNTVTVQPPVLNPSVSKFVSSAGQDSTIDLKKASGDYQPDYLKVSLSLKGETLTADKAIKAGDQVSWLIVGTAGNTGLLTSITDTLPGQFSFSPANKNAFQVFVVKNDGTLGDDITDNFTFKVEGQKVTATPKDSHPYFFVGNSTDSRYVILVNTKAEENIAAGTEFTNHVVQQTTNPKNPEKPTDVTSDAKVHIDKPVPAKPTGILPHTGEIILKWAPWLGGLLVLAAGVLTFITKRHSKKSN